jgi:NAD(P)-dependent dehydrogenase (short-subunit alcohol dehydrogenase family)
MTFQNQLILVTGGSNGIGLALAQAFVHGKEFCLSPGAAHGRPTGAARS